MLKKLSYTPDINKLERFKIYNFCEEMCFTQFGSDLAYTLRRLARYKRSSLSARRFSDDEEKLL
jgi:hypothetical protein